MSEGLVKMDVVCGLGFRELIALSGQLLEEVSSLRDLWLPDETP